MSERKGHRESSRRRRVEPIAISENGPREREGEAVARSLGLSGGAVGQAASRVCFGSAKTQPRLNVPRILNAAALCDLQQQPVLPKNWTHTAHLQLKSTKV